MRSRRFLWVWVGLVVAGWSFNYVIGKIALREFPAAVLSPLRLCLAAALMLPFYALEQRRRRETWELSELPALLVAGVLGAAGTQVLWVFGISRTSVAHGVIFSNLAPLLVLLLAAARGLERITAGKLGGLALALAGVATLKWFEPAAHAHVESAWTGDLLCFGVSVTFALFNAFVKPAMKRHGGATITAFGYVGGAILVAPFLIAHGSGFHFGQVSWVGWVSLLYMALVSSVLCYLAYYRVLEQLEPSRATAFGYLQPPVATLFGAMLLGEPVSPALLLPGLVILAGLCLAERSR